MDFELTDEQRLIQETVRSFVDDRVLPVAVQNDIEHQPRPRPRSRGWRSWGSSES